MSVQNDEAPRVSTRSKLESVLDDILRKIEDDNAPSVGGDDTVIDLETDAELILLAIQQLHNKYGVRSAERNNYKYGKYHVKVITPDDVKDYNRGGYSVEDWKRICLTLTGKDPVERKRDSDMEDTAG